MSDRRSYYRDWYEKNRTDVLRRRRNRYAIDPDHRQAVIDRAKRSRKGSSGEDRGPNVSRPSPLPSGGMLVSSGVFCRSLGISFSTLNRWEQRGIIPIGHLKDRDGRRWYPSSFVVFLRPYMSQRSRGRGGLAVFAGLVRDAWKKSDLHSEINQFRRNANNGEGT